MKKYMVKTVFNWINEGAFEVIKRNLDLIDVNSTLETGRNFLYNPLYNSAYQGKWDLFQLFLEQGGNIHLVINGSNLLSACLHNEKPSLKILNYLIKNTDLHNQMMKSLYMDIMVHPLHFILSSYSDKQKEAFEILINAVKEVDVKNDEKETPLIWALRGAWRADMAYKLFEKGASLKAKSQHNEGVPELLIRVCQDVQVFKKFLIHFDDEQLNEKTSKGLSLVDCALSESLNPNKNDIISELLKKGLKPSKKRLTKPEHIEIYNNMKLHHKLDHNISTPEKQKKVKL
jgi:hypothetical protein